MISFEHLKRLQDFEKFQWCGLKIEATILIQNLKAQYEKGMASSNFKLHPCNFEK